MGVARKYDAAEAEKEFVTSNVSIRALAIKFDVSFSTLAAYARNNDWKGKRMAYQNSLSRRSYEQMAADVAAEESQIRVESIAVMRATLRIYAKRLANGDVPVNTKDAVEAVRTLAVLLSEPEGTKDEPYNVTGSDRNKPDADFLRRAVEAARGRLASGPVLAGAAPGQPPGTKPN
jgi:transposase